MHANHLDPMVDDLCTDLVTHNDDAPQHYLRNTWVTAHLNCALHASTPHASATVNAWFSDPATAGPLFTAAIAALRPAFSFRAEAPIRAKAFDLIRPAAAALKPALIATPSDAPTVLAADALTEQLYFASGALHTNNEPHPTANQKTQWFTDAIGALENLTAVRHPHSCYQLLETLEFLIDENPARVFYAIAATIKSDSNFRYESLGSDAATRIADRYIAEHRQLFLAQSNALTELRRILETFATIGWPSALHLSYSLGDIFR